MPYFDSYIWANQRGIIKLEASNVEITDNAATYNFKPHRYLNVPYNGLILFKLPAITAPATAVNIVFNTNGSTITPTEYDDTALTTANTGLATGGVYLGYYESGSRDLRILTGV